MARTSARTSPFLNAAALACPVVALSILAPAASAQTRAPAPPEAQIDINVDRPGTANDGAMRSGTSGSSTMREPADVSTRRPMADDAMSRPMADDPMADDAMSRPMDDGINPPNDDRFPSQNVRGDIEGAEASAFNNGNISIEAGVDYATAYFFRGYNQEDSRVIVQPYGQLNVNIGELSGASVSVYAGVWNSLHEQPTLGDSVAYETDLYGGINFEFEGFTIGAIYTAYLYPGDAAEGVQEVGASVAFNDAELTSKAGIPFALNPSIAWFFEVDDGNGEEDQYLQFAIEPQVYSAFKDSDNQLDISIPVVLGTSPDGFFFDDGGSNEFLGFLSVGVAAGVPLPIPSSYGEWSLTGTVEYLFLFADSVETLNNDDDGEVIGRVGISFAY